MFLFKINNLASNKRQKFKRAKLVKLVIFGQNRLTQQQINKTLDTRQATMHNVKHGSDK
jgi:hypothetical protein